MDAYFSRNPHQTARLYRFLLIDRTIPLFPSRLIEIGAYIEFSSDKLFILFYYKQ